MKKWIFVLAAALCTLSLQAQAPVALEGAPREKAIASILKANDIRTESLAFDFVMTRHSTLMAEPLVSRGHAAYHYPDKVRWEVVSPKPSVFEYDASAATAASRL